MHILSSYSYYFLASKRVENSWDWLLCNYHSQAVYRTACFLILAPPPLNHPPSPEDALWLAGLSFPLRCPASWLVEGGLEWSAAENVPQEATRPPGCCCWPHTPLIRQTEAAGSLPELCIGGWMRLMLFCCTWKEERMGEEEGKTAPGECVGRRRVCALLRARPSSTFTWRY